MNDKQQQRALICALSHALIDKGSWCGETHLQKAAYVAAHWLGVREFQHFGFTLYTYGPFSFGLREELSEMRGGDWLKVTFSAGGAYGPTLQPSEEQDVASTFHDKFSFVAEEFGDKGVVALERLTTALLATEDLGESASPHDRAGLLRKWKPHLNEDEALQAVRNADKLLARAKAKNLLNPAAS